MRKTGERGFTVLEVLIGMVVLSLLAITAWSAAAISFRSASRIKASAMSSGRLLLLDDRIRDVALRIRFPWWREATLESGADGSWRIPYLDGDPKKTLALEFHAGVLTVDDGLYASRYPGFAAARLTQATDETGHAYGLVLWLGITGMRELTIVAAYGGAGLARGAAR
jgi:prepilin-type N-terminal cleavage/methylation domain-containing protein